MFIGPDGQLPDIVVRETTGNQVTNTSVGNNFGIAEPGNQVHSKDDKVRWGTWLFSFDNGVGDGQETDLQLWGFTTFSRGPIHAANIGTLTRTLRLHSEINGVGGLQGISTIFYGTVDGLSPSLEVE